jgi:hypothetical protein
MAEAVRKQLLSVAPAHSSFALLFRKILRIAHLSLSEADFERHVLPRKDSQSDPRFQAVVAKLEDFPDALQKASSQKHINLLNESKPSARPLYS